MSLSFDFTDKAQETLAAAIQIAKDYANAQGKHLISSTRAKNSCTVFIVHPVHIAFALLNEGAGAEGGPSQIPLFASVIQRAGGDPVCVFCDNLCLSSVSDIRLLGCHQT